MYIINPDALTSQKGTLRKLSLLYMLLPSTVFLFKMGGGVKYFTKKIEPSLEICMEPNNDFKNFF